MPLLPRTDRPHPALRVLRRRAYAEPLRFLYLVSLAGFLYAVSAPPLARLIIATPQFIAVHPDGRIGYWHADEPGVTLLHVGFQRTLQPIPGLAAIETRLPIGVPSVISMQTWIFSNNFTPHPLAHPFTIDDDLAQFLRDNRIPPQLLVDAITHGQSEATSLWPLGIAALALRTLAAAILVAVPVAILRQIAARRAIRRHNHGLCFACGYDLTGLTRRCPECDADNGP